MPAGSFNRVCRSCKYEYSVSRPACPRCGAIPVSRRKAFAATGPRLLLFVGLVFFAAWVAYALALSAEGYEEFKGFFFGLPRTASIVTGFVGAAGFLVANIVHWQRTRSGPKQPK